MDQLPPINSQQLPIGNKYQETPISLSQLKNSQLYLPIHARDPISGNFKLVSLPIDYSQLVKLFSTQNSQSRKMGISLNDNHGLQDQVVIKNSVNSDDHSYQNRIIDLFLQECCNESPSSSITRNELQQAYQKWATKRGQPHIAGNIMADYLNKLYKTTKIRKKTCYIGLELN